MLNVAVRAARAAGAIINHAALDLEGVRVAQKRVGDFVTEVDRASEEAIIDTLLAAYPQHGILAEESGAERGAPDADHVWVIDPLRKMTKLLRHRLSSGRSVTRAKPVHSQPSTPSAPINNLRLFSICAQIPPKKPLRVTSVLMPNSPGSNSKLFRSVCGVIVAIVFVLSILPVQKTQ